MPCRLNDGLHEWRNEIVTVPTKNLLNTLSRCKSRGPQVGSKDPVELYCSLLLLLILYRNKESNRQGRTYRYEIDGLSLYEKQWLVGSLAGVAPC